MKTLPALRLAIALALPIAASHAQDQLPVPAAPAVRAVPPAVVPAAAPVPAVARSELWQALRAAARELNAADDPGVPVPVRLDRIAAFRYSPATAAGLGKIFGSASPLRVERVPATKPGSAYRASLAPLRYTEADGLLTEWDALAIDIQVDRTGRGVEVHGRWPSIASGDEALRFGVRGLAYDARVRYVADGLWFGTAALRADSLDAGSDKEGFRVRAEDLRVDGRVTEKPKTVDQIVAMQVRQLRFGDQALDDVRLALRFLDFDKAATVELNRENQKLQLRADDLPPEQQLAAMQPMLRAMAKSMLARGAVAHIDELGASYGGHRATLKGQVRFEHATPADLDDIKLLVSRKLVARLEIRVPVALVREVAGLVAARQLAAQAAQAAQSGASADPGTVAQLRQSIADVIVGKLLGGGFARLDQEVLVSTLTWRDGMLRANGKPVPLPSPDAMAAQAGAPHPVATEPGPGNLLQARLVEGSCTLPGFPEDVVRDDRPLRQRIAFTIGQDGHVKDARVMQPSGFPDYDQAMLTALAQCTYIPALRNGRPIELRSSRDTVRSAGAGQR